MKAYSTGKLSAHPRSQAKLLSLALALGSFLLVDSQAAPSPLAGKAPGPYQFALIGDMPYSDQDASTAFPNLVKELNLNPLEFVIHDGDIKGGSAPCTDALFEQRRDLFNTIRHPFVLVFGDNEWTDCDNTNKIGSIELARDPLDRLAKLRQLFCPGTFAAGHQRLGLQRQANQLPGFGEFTENVRWLYGGVLYVGLNLPGSGNNFGRPAEFSMRQRANLAWLSDSFLLARRQHAIAVMVIIQANPQFQRSSNDSGRAGFNDFFRRLEEETMTFKLPVVLVHGDSHYFRIDKPMVHSASGRRVENFTRVETFGNPDMHWLLVTVDPQEPNVFTFRERIVAANKVVHE